MTTNVSQLLVSESSDINLNTLLYQGAKLLMIITKMNHKSYVNVFYDLRKWLYTLHHVTKDQSLVATPESFLSTWDMEVYKVYKWKIQNYYSYEDNKTKADWYWQYDDLLWGRCNLIRSSNWFIIDIKFPSIKISLEKHIQSVHLRKYFQFTEWKHFAF